MTDRVALDDQTALRVLRDGVLNVEERIVDASNATLYCTATLDGVSVPCVYKPEAGERPLWDFPDGTLAGRELAAYAVSEASGWRVVPPTVHRGGRFGPGMCQLWIDTDPTVDLVELARGDDPAVRRMAVFDTVVNNADRKGGHLLPTPDGHVYGIDHGVCFAATDKLRTVLWQWRGQPLPHEAVQALRRLRTGLDGGELRTTLDGLITVREVAAVAMRIERLLYAGMHPLPSGDWPPIPWPPF